MSNRRSIQGRSEKAFYDVFQQLCVRHSPWTIWCDFIKLFACSLSNALEPDMARREDREKMYLSTASGYTADELKQFVELASITILALDQNPQQDFLGNLYMSMDFGSSWHGQFFTPWHIASCMAKMTISDCEGELQDKGFVSVNDPTCGAGCMLLAAADAYRFGKPGQERNYQTDILFVGQDLDPVVALMCYIQLSLMGCAGYGSSEGIYGDIYLYGSWNKYMKDDPFRSRMRVYSLKTLEASKEAYIGMGMLVTLICFYANEFIRTHLDRFD